MHIVIPWQLVDGLEGEDRTDRHSSSASHRTIPRARFSLTDLQRSVVIHVAQIPPMLSLLSREISLARSAWRDQLILFSSNGCRHSARWRMDSAWGSSASAGVDAMAYGTGNIRAGSISPRHNRGRLRGRPFCHLAAAWCTFRSHRDPAVNDTSPGL